MRAGLEESIELDAPAERVWAYVMDWPRQSTWIPRTIVRVIDGDGESVGSSIDAWTGVGKVGFHDTMQITAWEPPSRCDVVHTGRVIRGSGIFEVVALGENRSRFDWREELEIPGGRAGYAVFWLAAPALSMAVRRSLGTLRRFVAK